MINPNFNIDNSSMNAVKAKVELYKGSTLVKTCTCSDALQKYAISRVGESNKFFGFGVCQKLDVVLIDLAREINLTKGDTIKVAVGDETNFVYPYPTFYIEEVTRDEGTNSLTLVAYDALYKANNHTISETGLAAPYTIRDVAEECANFFLWNEVEIIDVDDETPFDISYEEGANLDGSETIRQIFNAIAEATQTIYYITNQDNLVFKRLNKDGDPVYSITQEEYFSLTTGANETIQGICHATELGDNVTAGVDSGTVQYVRDNPFWELREDIATLLDNALAAIDGLSINQFVCKDWVGNYLLEIGDKIEFEQENGEEIITYLLNDSISYDGTLSEASQWTYEPNDGETASNPTSLGERLNQTTAKVDKANREISLVAGEADANSAAISALQINTESISASVSSLRETTEAEIDNIEENYTSLREEVKTKITANDITAEFITELGVGANEIRTSVTGYTFNNEGLTISKSDSEISTQITEDGMTISRSGEEVLVADNQGVKAEDLHATTYLIIGNNSRIEDWNGRTACFWIGG